MADFTRTMVPTSRLTQSVWTSGPDDGVPLLLVHGNLVSGGWWRYVAGALPDDVRVIAPDLRGFGRTDPGPSTPRAGSARWPTTCTRCSRRSAWPGRPGQRGRLVHGAGVLMQYLIDHAGDLASVTLVAPISPYGFGGTKGADGTMCCEDGAPSGAGGAAPDFVRRLEEGDRSHDDGSVRMIMRQFFGARGNVGNVDEEFLLDEVLLTATGEDHYPGEGAASQNWPTFGPGRRGVLNAMAPTHYDTSAIADLDVKPPITWLRGGQDQVIGDASMFDLAHLGKLGVIRGGPATTCSRRSRWTSRSGRCWTATARTVARRGGRARGRRARHAGRGPGDRRGHHRARLVR
jgi:pimeloyl-ACP methyl ester carboxylesterase